MRPKRFIAVLAVLALFLMAYLFWSGIHVSAPTTKLSVVFVGITNSPTRTMTPTRIEVCQGATGLCAMFWVTNIDARQTIWFKTTSVEQKTEAGWRPFVPSGGAWSGIEGSLWQAGYGCFYAVGWPPGLPTNATWRLQVSYGRDPSNFGIIVNQETGRNIFPSGKKESTISSSQVNQ